MNTSYLQNGIENFLLELYQCTIQYNKNISAIHLNPEQCSSFRGSSYNVLMLPSLNSAAINVISYTCASQTRLGEARVHSLSEN